MRTTSAPTTSHGPVGGHRTTASVSTSSSDTSSQPSAKDDSVLNANRPGSFINLSSSIPDLSLSLDAPVKASPDRYRRPGQKRTDSSVHTAPATSLQPGTTTYAAAASTQTPQIAPVQRQASVDDMSLPKSGQSELAKRYRRRSLNQLDTQVLAAAPEQAQGPPSGHGATSTPTSIRPGPLGRQDGDAVSQTPAKAPLTKADSGKDTTSVSKSTAPTTRTEPKLAVPVRGSSDGTKRLAAPSPLSRQASDSDSKPSSVAPPSTKARTYAAVAQSAVHTPSAAAAQLAAVSDKDLNKGMKSRLRRAFSFGSAQELKRAGPDGKENTVTSHAQQTRQQHQQQIDDELDAEQMEIARRQEAAGIGAGIYSGQGGFSGSTDNLSISSTASSASMMLRKMGRGAKKGARSVKSLFRPKSVIGVPAADGPIDIVQPSVAQVSMVTVEAERQNVNVNAHPGELADGGTGFPKLERNSMDAGAAAAAAAVEKQRGSADGSDSRRSIVGSDKDRAEVLAAVKKGILKRSGTNSPSGSPIVRPMDAGHTPVPLITESPSASNPSTPREQPQGRSASAPNVNGDYFTARGMARSMPATPNGSVRSISFSPRIQFHDVWSSTDYDRRGEVATCNRLTPMLAQQIKEELNTFKMVCLRLLTTWNPR